MNKIDYSLIIPNASAIRLKLLRLSCDLTRERFQEACGIKASTLRAWEEGVNPINQKAAAKLEAAFTRLNKFCPEAWLLNGAGPAPSFEGLIQSSTIAQIAATKTGNTTISREMEFFCTVNPNPIIYEIIDDSMLPQYNLGDYVAGNKVFSEDIAKLDNCNCIVITTDDQILCGRLNKTAEQNKYNLTAINPNITEPTKFNVELKAAAEIVLHRKGVNS
jgi:transcriptional regulator with XRE-family HTH domain